MKLRGRRGKIWVFSVLFVPLVPSEPVQQVEVKAQRFKFTPARIRVPLGTRLEIELSSRDVVHGFEIPSAGIETKIPPRGKGSATVVYLADKKGKIPFRCSHKCGAGHASMRGMIIVEEGGRRQEAGSRKKGMGKRLGAISGSAGFCFPFPSCLLPQTERTP